MRCAELERVTGETRVKVRLKLDGGGTFQGRSGIAFLDHMLHLWTRHALFDLTLEAVGDLEVDFHHTVEDIGITLGQALREALGNKEGIARYGFFLLPMDESLAQVALDLSGRPCLVYDVPVSAERVGDFPVELVPEFFQAFVNNAGITLHLHLIRGSNTHHIIESLFKGFGRSLRQAVAPAEREKGVPSTKGVL